MRRKSFKKFSKERDSTTNSQISISQFFLKLSIFGNAYAGKKINITTINRKDKTLL